MRFKKVLLAILVILLVPPLNTFADAPSQSFIDFDDFESYDTEVPHLNPWGFNEQGGTHPAAPLVYTKYGKSAKIVTNAGKYLEVNRSYIVGQYSSTAPDNIVGLYMGISACFMDKASDFTLMTWAKGGVYPSFATFSKDGYVYIGGVKTDVTYSTEVWYDIVIEVNLENNNLRLTLSDGENVSTAKGVITTSAKNFGRFMISKQAPDSGQSVTYIDNTWLRGTTYSIPRTEDGFYREAFGTPSGLISPDTDEFTFKASDDIDAEKLSEASVTINGKTDDISEVTADGKTLTIKLKNPVGYGRMIFLEVAGVQNAEGKKASGIAYYITNNKFTVEDFSITETEGETPKIKTTLKISSLDENFKDAVLVTVLYKKADNEMLGIAADFSDSLNPTPAELKTELSVPDCEYYAVSYLWDNMMTCLSLQEPKTLN